MNVLIDLGHPTHVHLFKNFIKYLKENDHNIVVISRDKDITKDLLEYYNIEHTVISKAKSGIPGMLSELLVRDLKTVKLHLEHKFDISFGTSVNIAHLTTLFGVPSYVFSEDDDGVIPLFAYSTYPFATGIIIPEGLKYKKWKNKRIKHKSSHKLAYLHPNNFKPNPEVLKKYSLRNKKYIITRRSSLKAHHDKNAKGISKELWEKLEPLFKNYNIIDSKEGVDNKKIDFYDMHDLLYYAKLLICDSQSMSVEAAMLGTPCVRISSFKGKINILEELENKYKLLFSYHPHQEEKIKKKVQELLKNEDTGEEFQKKKDEMLKNKVDFTKWMVEFFQNNQRC